MQTPKDPLHLRMTLPLVVAAIVIGGIFIGIRFHDPHWLNRSGALIAAIAAGAILVQMQAELEIESERERIEDQISAAAQKSSPATLLDDLEFRVLVNKLNIKKRVLAQGRLKAARFVVTSAMLGELLHGFGDLPMCAFFDACLAH